MENEAEFMVNAITEFIHSHSESEAEQQFAVSKQVLEQFDLAVEQANYELALSLIPSANYLNIFDQSN